MLTCFFFLRFPDSSDVDDKKEDAKPSPRKANKEVEVSHPAVSPVVSKGKPYLQRFRWYDYGMLINYRTF